MVFVGDDWAEDHHDIFLMDADGARLASRRLPEGLPGIGGFHELVAAHVEEPSQVVIGIETDRGLWVAALSAAGYQVYAVNPLAVSVSDGLCTGVASETEVTVVASERIRNDIVAVNGHHWLINVTVASGALGAMS